MKKLKILSTVAVFSSHVFFFVFSSVSHSSNVLFIHPSGQNYPVWAMVEGEKEASYFQISDPFYDRDFGRGYVQGWQAVQNENNWSEQQGKNVIAYSINSDGNLSAVTSEQKDENVIAYFINNGHVSAMKKRGGGYYMFPNNPIYPTAAETPKQQDSLVNGSEAYYIGNIDEYVASRNKFLKKFGLVPDQNSNQSYSFQLPNGSTVYLSGGSWVKKD